MNTAKITAIGEKLEVPFYCRGENAENPQFYKVNNKFYEVSQEMSGKILLSVDGTLMLIDDNVCSYYNGQGFIEAKILNYGGIRAIMKFIKYSVYTHERYYKHSYDFYGACKQIATNLGIHRYTRTMNRGLIVDFKINEIGVPRAMLITSDDVVYEMSRIVINTALEYAGYNEEKGTSVVVGSGLSSEWYTEFRGKYVGYTTVRFTHEYRSKSNTINSEVMVIKDGDYLTLVYYDGTVIARIKDDRMVRYRVMFHGDDTFAVMGIDENKSIVTMTDGCEIHNKMRNDFCRDILDKFDIKHYDCVLESVKVTYD